MRVCDPSEQEEDKSDSSEGEQDAKLTINGANKNDLVPKNTQPIYDNHTCHHASPKLDSLVEMYTILDRRGVANYVFDDIVT
jgi:hypothetical protein